MKSSSRSMMRGAWVRVALIGLIAGSTVDSGSALQSARSAPTGFITGVVQRQPGSRSRRLGHRRDQGPADQLHQDRRHRRSGPLHAAGTAGGQLQRLGPRLRPRRFDADRDEAGARPRSTLTRHAGEDAAGSGEGLSRATTGCRCSSRPPTSEFPGTGAQGNGLGPSDADAEPLDQLAQVRLQLLPSARQPADAQRRPRLQGEARAQDARRGVGVAARHRRARHVDVRRAEQPGQGADRSKVYADWTERIAKGEVPPAPPRPKGVERNVVVTLWDVGDDHSFMHDEISTDKNHPTVNADGPVYAVSAGHGQLVVLDPNDEHDRRARHPDARRRGRRCRRASRRRTVRRCTGATSISGPIRRTTRPIRTTRCSTARAACG